MALRFGKKRDTPETGEAETPSFEPQPDKAHKWFAHARAMSDSYSYDSALVYFANGIKLDPKTMSAHEDMYNAARQYLSQGGSAAARKDIRNLDGPHPVDKFTAAEFAWMKDLNNASLALKFLEASIKAMEWAAEAGRWHCPRVLNVLRHQKKPGKSTFLEAMELFPQLGAWDEALAAGEEALRLDPDDATLDNELKDLAAQRAMDHGRYEEAAGEEGGFRKFVKDMDKQRELEDAEAISGGLDVDQRNLDRACRLYEETPGSPDLINQYGQLVKTVGTAEAQEQAHEIFMKGFKDTGQYRFRVSAGDIRIEQAQGRVAELREKLDQDGENTELKSALEKARRGVFDLQYVEFSERAGEYPTDQGLKHRLGQVEFELKKIDEAIRCFQQAKEDPKFRVQSGYMLGRCFAQKLWQDMAIEEYKDSLGKVEAGDRDTELAIRYDLMIALMAHARDEESIDLAREALDIASSIARKDITYRDIRNCRVEADELIKQLKTPSSNE